MSRGILVLFGMIVMLFLSLLIPALIKIRRRYRAWLQLWGSLCSTFKLFPRLRFRNISDKVLIVVLFLCILSGPDRLIRESLSSVVK